MITLSILIGILFVIFFGLRGTVAEHTRELERLRSIVLVNKFVLRKQFGTIYRDDSQKKDR